MSLQRRPVPAQPWRFMHRGALQVGERGHGGPLPDCPQWATTNHAEEIGEPVHWTAPRTVETIGDHPGLKVPVTASSPRACAIPSTRRDGSTSKPGSVSGSPGIRRWR
jgi:hypothetical protein